MKAIHILIFNTLLIGLFSKTYAQTLNWNTIDQTKHIISIGIAWDYSLSYSAGYAYAFDTKIPVVAGVNLSIPSGEKLLDDFKIKAGGQIAILNHDNLKIGILLNGIYRRFENPLVRLQNFGGEIKGTFGYYQKKWFVAGEVGFDKAIVTHFKHSDYYKDYIYQDVKDGWYEPATGGNFLYGLQAGYSFTRSDVTLNIGKVATQDFKTTPRIPYYVFVGYNHVIGSK